MNTSYAIMLITQFLQIFYTLVQATFVSTKKASVQLEFRRSTASALLLGIQFCGVSIKSEDFPILTQQIPVNGTSNK